MTADHEIDYTPTEMRILAHMEELHKAQHRSPLDVLADAYGGRTRKERRAFKSRMKNLVRKEARKSLRRSK